MRHVGPAALDRIEPLLEEIRAIGGDLTEKKRGTFYRRSRAFLHFHEDGDDVYADVRLDGDDFKRVKATSSAEQRQLVARIRTSLDMQS
jgi:hypothetical protein